jgi:hypothetical protein
LRKFPEYVPKTGYCHYIYPYSATLCKQMGSSSVAESRRANLGVSGSSLIDVIIIEKSYF